MKNVIHHYTDNSYLYIPDDNFHLCILHNKGKNIGVWRLILNQRRNYDKRYCQK